MSQKKPRVDNPTWRPPMDECLPLEILEVILGLLDQETLCTARLVSRTLCAAAALHICNLAVTNTQAVSSHRFPHLRHVALELNRNGKSIAQLEPRLRNLTTTLTVNLQSKASIWEALSEVPLMPKLQKLDVQPALKHGAALLRLCTNLEALHLHCGCTKSVATTIVKLTQLTSLLIGNRVHCGRSKTEGNPTGAWWKLATNLRNLQDLHIYTLYEHFPLIGNLTGLTGLTLWDAGEDETEEPTYSIAPLIGLTRLRSFYLGMDSGKRNLRLACSLGLGSLVNLELWGCEDNSSNCGRFLSRQTALTRLSLHGGPLCNLRHIGALRIELLQSLKLHDLRMLDAEGISVLSRATSLKQIGIGIGFPQPQQGLSQVLAQLTQLRSLRLASVDGQSDTKEYVDFHVALSPLTALTKLKVRSHGLDDGQLGAVVVLTSLRVLELDHCRLTDELLPELGLLTNLTTLRVSHCGVTSLAPVTEVLDPLRKARGLQPLSTSVRWR